MIFPIKSSKLKPHLEECVKYLHSSDKLLSLELSFVVQSQVQADARVYPKVNLLEREFDLFNDDFKQFSSNLLEGEFDLFNDDFKQLSSNLLGGEFDLSHDHFKTTNLAPLLQVKHLKKHNFNTLF